MEKDMKFCDPPLLLRTASAGGFIRTNDAFRSMVGFSESDLVGEPFLHWIDPADLESARLTLAGHQSCCRVQHRTLGGDFLPLDIQVDELESEQLIMARWPQDEEAANGPKDAEDEATITGTLHTIAHILEDQNPGYKCSILLVADGKFVRGAGPSLPEEYNAAIDGFAIGPTLGSCGTAIFWGIPVIVENIQADPLWAPIAELAKKAGVASCWSHPFASRNGNVLGALAFYSAEPQAPSKEQLGRLQAAARMTGLAVERGRAEESLRKKRQRELELEEQLRQAEKMEALGVLAGGIAHDFNNILATILVNAEFGKELLPTNSAVNEMLTNIVESSKRAGQFCQRMLDYAGHGTMTNTTIEIGALLSELNNLVQAALSKKITMEYSLLEETVYIEGDESQLLQVLMNLVTNAAEAIGEDEGRILVSSKLVTYDEQELQSLDPNVELAPGQYLQLSVSDTGTGLDTETEARIFDPFFTTKDSGHGLGLSAVRGIVKSHGGAIQIRCEAYWSTTFTVIFPPVVHVPEEVEKAKSAHSNLSGKVILVVDDEEALREILSRKLKHAGYKTLLAADGQEAVEVFSENQESIDCVLMDFNMPKLNGEEALHAIQAIRQDIPVIMMSGFSEQEVIARFRDSGIAGCLQKPMGSDTLVETINGAMAR